MMLDIKYAIFCLGLLILSCCKSNKESKICINDKERILYAEKFSSICGVNAYFDYDQAKACAIESNTPILLVFGAWGASRFHRFQEDVLRDKNIEKMCLENFIVVYLYVDDKSLLPMAERYKSKIGRDSVKTLGNKNSELQIKYLKSGSQPQIAIFSADDKIIAKYDYTTLTKKEFNIWLQSEVAKL